MEFVFIFRRLLTQLNSFKPQSDKPSSAPASSASTVASTGSADHVTYQLYYRPEQAKFSNNAKVCRFRITRLCTFWLYVDEYMAKVI